MAGLVKALTACNALNAKRLKRGIQPRAVRAAVIGFPNVGKSALINRLLGRKMAVSRDKAGVTRKLMWVRLGGSAAVGSQVNTIELLDSPGIIPARQFDQAVALKLAICNDIGDASYDRVLVAGAMCDLLKTLAKQRSDFVDVAIINNRYKLPFMDLPGSEMVRLLAQKQCQGDEMSAADKLLTDFRKGVFGFSSLESTADAPVLRPPPSTASAAITAPGGKEELAEL
eukprot:gene32350-39940_t